MSNKSNLIFATKEAFGITLEPTGTFNITDSFELDGDGNVVSVELATETSVVLKDGTQIERMTITATGGVATIVTRGLTPGDTPVEDVDLRKPWGDGTTMYSTQLAFDTFDMTETNSIITGIIKLLSTTLAQIQFQNLTTAQITTLGGTLGATDNVIVKDTDTGEHKLWNGSAWDVISAGSTQPNASETVAGKVEVATQSEFDAGTDVGGTGARLMVIPSFLIDATTLLRGLVVRATEAESLTGTNDTKYITPKNKTRQSVIFFSRNTNEAGGAVTYAHGLGKIPSGVRLDSGSANSTQGAFCGFSDGSTQGCLYDTATSPDRAISSTFSIRINGSTSAVHQEGVISAFDDTNFTITWSASSTSDTDTLIMATITG